MREMKIMMKMTMKDIEQPKLLVLFLQRTLNTSDYHLCIKNTCMSIHKAFIYNSKPKMFIASLPAEPSC